MGKWALPHSVGGRYCDATVLQRAIWQNLSYVVFCFVDVVLSFTIFVFISNEVLTLVDMSLESFVIYRFPFHIFSLSKPQLTASNRKPAQISLSKRGEEFFLTALPSLRDLSSSTQA